MHHNQFSPEVNALRTTISNYGGPAKYRNRHSAHSDSYKKQALVELASRLELEGEIEQLKKRIGALEDQIEAAQA